jgi:O-antigen/teichoic acid export membrane protein
MQQEPSLAERSITSATWNVGSSLISLAILAVRAVLLARWLPVETFGVYTLASATVAFTSPLASFGLTPAFLNRTEATAVEERGAATHFTLTAVLTLTWATLMAACAAVLAQDELRSALLVLIASSAILNLCLTPRAVLVRRVTHRRLAVLQVLTAIFTTLVALALAARGADLWALLATDVTTAGVAVAVFYGWRPVWTPRLAWSKSDIRYFLRFGLRSTAANFLQRALERLDDLWTGLVHGQTALGFYSRAFVFATYPRRFLSMPLTPVAGGLFAELKGDRQRLSRVFFQVIALLLRGGFLLAGLLTLTAPELIHLLIGDRWLPILTPFRFMLIFALLDPIKNTVAQFFMGVGRPGIVVRARVVQLAVLALGLVTLGWRFGIVGVAMSLDLMLAIGILLLMLQARRFVDFSLPRIFLIPTLALGLAFLMVISVTTWALDVESAWIVLILKGSVFGLSYVASLVAMEWQRTTALVRFALRTLR